MLQDDLFLFIGPIMLYHPVCLTIYDSLRAQTMRARQLAPRLNAFNSLIAAAGRAFRLGDATDLVADLAAAGHPPDAFTYAAALHACQRAEEAELAFDILQCVAPFDIRFDFLSCPFRIGSEAGCRLLSSFIRYLSPSIARQGPPLTTACRVSQADAGAAHPGGRGARLHAHPAVLQLHPRNVAPRRLPAHRRRARPRARHPVRSPSGVLFQCS